MSLKVTFLGTGTSHGVPMIGCACDVCRSTDAHDQRTRPSILIEIGADDDPVDPAEHAAVDSLHTESLAGRPSLRARSGNVPGSGSPIADAVRTILVDTSTDLRAQALAHKVARVDAILFTHSHADHILGLDEVRRFNVLQKGAMPCYGDERTLDDIRKTFSYIFSKTTFPGGGTPQILLTRILGPFSLGGVEILPVPIFHGPRPILGFRLGSFAYLTDCSRIPDGSWSLLAGVRTLVIDALRERPHPTHFSVGEALEAVARVAPERAYFTHICHDLPHAATCARLPAGVELAYDGLVLQVA